MMLSSLISQLDKERTRPVGDLLWVGLVFRSAFSALTLLTELVS